MRTGSPAAAAGILSGEWIEKIGGRDILSGAGLGYVRGLLEAGDDPALEIGIRAADGKSRLAYLRQLQDGMETSFRRFVWTDSHISEERDKSGTNVLKRFYPQGVKVLTGPKAGNYFYTRDHLGSVRALTDSSGAVRARYAYDPWGRRTKSGVASAR